MRKRPAAHGKLPPRWVKDRNRQVVRRWSCLLDDETPRSSDSNRKPQMGRKARRTTHDDGARNREVSRCSSLHVASENLKGVKTCFRTSPVAYPTRSTARDETNRQGAEPNDTHQGPPN